MLTSIHNLASRKCKALAVHTALAPVNKSPVRFGFAGAAFPSVKPPLAVGFLLV
jgi:hypothetical protein